MRRLPPLNALRAFEAAARHLSFTRAAEELHVTPAAVSHQIKALEEWAGAPLFRRLTREIRLTETGQAALPLIGEGLDRLADGADRLRAEEEGGVLTVTVAPTFAGKWMVPRLDRFNALHPDISIRVDASMGLVDFERDAVDCALRFGTGDYPGQHVEKLFNEFAVPVCSPELLARADPPIERPEDLLRHRLLHVNWAGRKDFQPDWLSWFAAAGVELERVPPGPTFTLESLAIEAAIKGQGVVLVNTTITSDDVGGGRLVIPFDLTVATTFAYWFVCPERSMQWPKVAAFRDWVMDEAAEERRRLGEA